MSKPIDRREFLKLAALSPLSLLTPQLMMPPTRINSNDNPPNILILVFDAFSALNIDLYGYSRATTPNLARFAEQAHVYHNHFAGGRFTPPGTATLISGVYPWSHRTFSLNDILASEYVGQNIFSSFDTHFRTAYTHNLIANTILKQVQGNLEQYVPQHKLLLEASLLSQLFDNDLDTALISWDQIIKKHENSGTNSLFLTNLFDLLNTSVTNRFRKDFPLGPPGTQVQRFLLEDAIDFISLQVAKMPNPYLAYFHMLPPHEPYNTRVDFFNRFKNDGQSQLEKPLNYFSIEAQQAQETLYRRRYDEFILYTDHEFGRLMDNLEATGGLENTWVIVTSDHGEMSERGILKHDAPVFYQPVVRIPLLIRAPGQQSRFDFHQPTSAVDILPTLCQIAGLDFPAWTEGQALPPFGPTEAFAERPIFAIDAEESPKYKPLRRATVMMVKGQYKITKYFGYRNMEKSKRIEVYDLAADPEEMTNLFYDRPNLAAELREELEAAIATSNQKYRE